MPSRANNFRVLTVCTMNICRSQAMEFVVGQLVRQHVPELVDQIEVVSAGTAAVEGAPSCRTIMSLIGAMDDAGEWNGTSQQLTTELIESADVIVAATSDHADAVVQLVPGVRTRVFPFRQAAAVGRWILEGPALEVAKRKASGEVIERDFNDPVTLVEPLPAGGVDQLRWLVDELDAFRGVAPVVLKPLVAEVGPLDLPDPHVLGDELHEVVAGEIRFAQ